MGAVTPEGWAQKAKYGPCAMGQAHVINIQSDFFPHKTLTLHSLSGTEGVKSALCLQESSPVYM